MKTYCKPKDIDIEDYHFNESAVAKCLVGKERRYRFAELLVNTGEITQEELTNELNNREYHKRLMAYEGLSKELTQRIIDRDLGLPSELSEFERCDGLSGKVRLLTKETPEQQCYNYIAVEALMPLFKAKILPCQFGSIPGRGQTAGARSLERIMRKKLREDIDCVKCDIRHAYKSTDVNLVLALLQRDIGKNKVLLWFLQALMANYPGGKLIIGGFLSTWLFNYVMSYFLRYLFNIVRVRRGVRIKVVKAIVCYADDFVMFGNMKSLIWAMKRSSTWLQNTFNLSVKPDWQLVSLSSFEEEKDNLLCRNLLHSRKRTQGVDMMGYVVRRRYTIIRKRIYKRVRRYLIRAKQELTKLGYVPWWRAQTLMSYFGFIVHTRNRLLDSVLDVSSIINAAKRSLHYIFAQKEVCMS